MADEFNETQDFEIETPVVETPVEVKDESTPEDIEYAKRLGWHEDYNGPSEKKLTAKQFIERGENELPIVRERLRDQSKKLDDALNKISNMNKTMDRFVDFTRQNAQREADKRIEALTAKKNEAFDAGDREAFNEAEKEIQNIQKTEAAPASADTGEVPFKEWWDANPWYRDDSDMKAYADGIAGQLREKGLQGIELLNEARKRVEKMFPHKFSNPNRNAPAPVGSGNSTGASGRKGKTFNDLPADAQAMCRDFEEMGLMTREEYLKDYQW